MKILYLWHGVIMNKKILYGLILLLTLSLSLGIVSASENITESAVLSVGESYVAGDEALSLSYEESIENDQTLSLSSEESISDNETLSLSNEEIIEDGIVTLKTSNEDNTEVLSFGESVVTQERGADYVSMSNGFTAFCAKRLGTFPTSGTPYITEQQYILTHVETGARVDNKLRLAVIHYADRPEFQEKVRFWRIAAGSFSRTQMLIWYLTQYDTNKYCMQDLDGDPILKNAYYDIINRHNNGEWIPEEGITYKLDDTHEVKYEFLAFKSSSTYQTLFGFKKIIKEIPPTPKNPGMEVDKKSLTPNVKVGEQTLFLITVRNTGDVNLNNVFVEEQIPDGLTFSDYNDKTKWRRNGNTFYYNDVLRVGESASFTIAFNTHRNGTFVNCVVADSDETDSKKANNTTTVLKGNLDVQKITVTPKVLVGDQVTFEIVVRNTGNIDLSNVFVEETSYAGLKFEKVLDNGHWTHSVTNGKNRWTLNSNLAVNEVMGFFIVFNTTHKGNFTNVIIAGSDESDNKTTNNTTTVVDGKFDVQKITITPKVLVGDQVTFEIVVRNTGDIELSNVFVEETSYAGLKYEKFIDNGYWTHSITNNKNRWTLNGNLAVNEVKGFFIVFNTTRKGNFTNVIVAGSDETENKTTHNNTTVLEPKLDVQKVTITPKVSVGDQVKFEIIVKNTGDVALENVFVKELSYEGLTYASFEDNGLWKYNGQQNVWTLNKVLAVNEVETLIVTFNTTQKGNFTNVVVAGSDKTENKTTNNTTTVVEPKLDVRKITINPVVLVGDQVTFEIIVKNIGEATLTNVFVEETSYAGLKYEKFIDNGYWTHSIANGKNTWTLNTNLAVNEVVGLFVVFNTTQKGNFTNVVVAGSDETENKTTNNTTKVVEPKLDVQKITLTPIVPVGNQTSFEIVVRNTGEVALHNVVLEETSYDGLVYDSFVNNGLWTHSVANGKNIWTLNKVLNVREAVNLIVNFNTVEVGNFTNIVTVGSTETENKIANNTTNVYNKTTPEPESNTTKNPNINIEKIALNDVVIVGQQAIFEIIVTNNGEVVLHDVTVTEDSFVGLEYTTFFDNTGLWSNNELTWTLNTPLYVGEMASFYVVFNTTTPGKFTNIVSVDSNETDKKSANDTVEVIKPEMDVQKISINKSVMVGDQVTFEIIVENTGKVTLNNVVVREESYDGLKFDSFIDHTGLWTKNSDLSWKLNTPLYAGEYAGFFVVFNTTNTGKFVNVIVAGSDETPNKTDNDTVDVFKGNIDVQKITLTPVVHVGNQTSFEILVKNIGEIPLHNVVLEETSYDGLVYHSFVNNGLWTPSVSNGKNIWTLNRVLNVNEMVTLIVNFNTVAVGNFTNIVTVSSDETDNKVANNTTIVYNNTKPTPEEDPSKNPNINIEKIALHKVVIAGSNAVFEIIVTNTGDTVLHDVTVSEDSFTGLTYDSWYDNTGLWSKNSGLTWTMNSPLYVGEIASFYVVFKTTNPGDFTNIVSVDSNETDKKSANDTVKVIKPDFAVEKITINRSVLVGEQVMFEIVVHNLGQTDLNNVVVRETSFAGLVYDSFIDNYGLWTKNSGLSWTLNTPLRVGEYAGFFVVFNTTTTGNFVNVVVADSTEIPNKTANDTVEVLQPKLEVQKITVNRTVYVGEKVKFEIVVHNAGKVVLNDVTVRENSFDGLIYDSFIDNNNLWTKNNDLSWTLNTPLYAGEYLSFYVVFNTNKAGTFTNVVSASSDKTQDIPANNITTVIDRPVPDENKTTPEDNKTYMADLAITKVVYAIDGNKVTWGLYVVNNGPDKAVNARVIDVLPNTLQYINSYASKGSYNVNTGVWTIGDMENGEEAVMIMQTIVLTTGEITNEANVTSDTYDPNMSNNYDNETVVVSDVPETPQQPVKENVEPVDVTPATGNPLVMVLLALFVLAAGTLRRKK